MTFGPFDFKSRELLDTDLVNPETILSSHKFIIHTVVSEAFCQFSDDLICRRLFQLPFDKVLFEFAGSIHDRISRIAILGAKFSDDNICVIPFIRYHDATWTGGINYHLELYPKEARWGNAEAYNDPNDPDWFDHQWFIADVFAATVAMLGSSKYQTSQVDIPSKLAKARERRDRPPLFAYKVLTLTGETSRRNDLGGTHALRRLSTGAEVTSGSYQTRSSRCLRASLVRLSAALSLKTMMQPTLEFNNNECDI